MYTHVFYSPPLFPSTLNFRKTSRVITVLILMQTTDRLVVTGIFVYDKFEFLSKVVGVIFNKANGDAFRQICESPAEPTHRAPFNGIAVRQSREF